MSNTFGKAVAPDRRAEEAIQEKLDEIERRENVRILHCAESGSRAWGFASPDSDYDARFIYVRPREFYLRLDATRDVIEWQLDDVFDIVGWDVKKALTLLHKSNATLFEWNNSPIVYRTTPGWARISEVIGRYFQQKAGLYHYLNTAKNNYREYLRGQTVRLKKYFYVLRPVLACRWILARNSPPPMLFSQLADACLEPSVVPAVNELLRQKRNSSECGEGKRVECLHEYLDAAIPELERRIAALPEEEPRPWEELNALFLALL